MLRVVSPFVAASVAGLLAQVNEDLWTKGGWVFACTMFVTGIGVLFHWIQKLVADRLADKDAIIRAKDVRICALEAEVASLERRANNDR